MCCHGNAGSSCHGHKPPFLPRSSPHRAHVRGSQPCRLAAPLTPLTPDNGVGQGDCSTHTTSTRVVSRTVRAFIKNKKTPLCLLKCLFFPLSFMASVPLRWASIVLIHKEARGKSDSLGEVTPKDEKCVCSKLANSRPYCLCVPGLAKYLLIFLFPEKCLVGQ